MSLKIIVKKSLDSKNTNVLYRIPEQNAIIQNGGVTKLDNMRNEIADKKWDDQGVTY